LRGENLAGAKETDPKLTELASEIDFVAKAESAQEYSTIQKNKGVHCGTPCVLLDGYPIRDYLVVSVVVVFVSPSFLVSVVVFFFSPQPIAKAQTTVRVISKPKNFFIKTSKQGVEINAIRSIHFDVERPTW
jgi:hypothetical protein